MGWERRSQRDGTTLKGALTAGFRRSTANPKDLPARPSRCAILLSESQTMLKGYCQSSLKMSPSLPRLKCPLFVFWFALFFFPCARSPFSSKNFALGCPRNDDSYLGRPTASPVFGRPVGLVRSAVLRSPKGGAFRAQRRARPTTAGLRRPPWTRASPSLGESPLATGDSLAAPTSFWPSAELADWPA